EDAVTAVSKNGNRTVAGSDDGMLARNGTFLSLPENPERIRIAFIDQPNATSLPVAKPRYQFYYDTHVLGKDGDGTERDPWPDLPAALAGLAKLCDEGRVQAGSGAQIQLSRRQIFTASSLEKRKQIVESAIRFLLM